ncbi:MAG TPA: ATP-binding protein, partial [Chloroflexota bacterium]|nr:ATP-binding protein [Chloroflexota bacterium]
MRRPDAGAWRSEEFVHIAREQCRRENEAARQANRLLVCDTDAFATTLWHERYVGTPSQAVAAVAAGRRADLYVLTDVDIPFVQDGTRDGEHLRHWMHDRFIAELTREGHPYIVVSG